MAQPTPCMHSQVIGDSQQEKNCLCLLFGRDNHGHNQISPGRDNFDMKARPARFQSTLKFLIQWLAFISITDIGRGNGICTLERKVVFLKKLAKNWISLLSGPSFWISKFEKKN